MSKFITADWHLGEDRMAIIGRPFSSPGEMIEELIIRYNNIVGSDDEVMVVGDVCYQKTPEFIKHVKRFNGVKTLVAGNHDRVFSDSDLKEYFIEIIPDGQGVELEVEGISCYAVHYPTQGRYDKFNLTGHVHTAWKYQLNMLNVGVDVHCFRPVNLNTIPFHLKAISEYYDEDVWVAYHDVNKNYRGIRGKAGSYFEAP